jgi:hypothetical protein
VYRIEKLKRLSRPRRKEIEQIMMVGITLTVKMSLTKRMMMIRNERVITRLERSAIQINVPLKRKSCNRESWPVPVELRYLTEILYIDIWILSGLLLG